MLRFPKILFLHGETKKPFPMPPEQYWPDSWKTVEFKEYPRLPKFTLPDPGPLRTDFGDLLRKRSSRREFDPKKTLSSEELSSLLFWSAGIKRGQESPERSRRFYPSGGARYPLEVYGYFRGNREIPEGIYHYNVKGHHLEKMPIEAPGERIRLLPTWRFAYDAPFFFFITGVSNRSMQKYKARGYRFMLLEAGILLHNFYLSIRGRRPRMLRHRELH